MQSWRPLFEGNYLFNLQTKKYISGPLCPMYTIFLLSRLFLVQSSMSPLAGKILFKLHTDNILRPLFQKCAIFFLPGPFTVQSYGSPLGQILVRVAYKDINFKQLYNIIPLCSFNTNRWVSNWLINDWFNLKNWILVNWLLLPLLNQLSILLLIKCLLIQSPSTD